jgi:hypothetical protein
VGTEGNTDPPRSEKRQAELLLAGKHPNNVWDRIVAKYDLRSQNLRELVGLGTSTQTLPSPMALLKDLRPLREPSSFARLDSRGLLIPRTRSVTRCSPSSTTNCCRPPRNRGGKTIGTWANGDRIGIEFRPQWYSGKLVED